MADVKASALNINYSKQEEVMVHAVTTTFIVKVINAKQMYAQALMM